jgi:hypothetical protein
MLLWPVPDRATPVTLLWPVSDRTTPAMLLWPVSDRATLPTEGLPTNRETFGRTSRRGRETVAKPNFQLKRNEFRST